jgi:hypothetical protein
MAAAAGWAAQVPSAVWAAPGPQSVRTDAGTDLPITPVAVDARANDFNGDDINRPHDWLWNKAEFLAKRGGLPVPEKTVGVAVIGGGIAGLTAAYRLRNERPWVLEGAPQLGGNSKGETWAGSTYGIGAAYITRPDAGSDIEGYLRELGLLRAMRADEGEDWDALGTEGTTTAVWKGEAAPALAQFKRIREEAFPDIPPKKDSALTANQLSALDSRSFEDWIQKDLVGSTPRLRGLLREYCCSSFGADPVELSAAQALNFVAGDLGGTVALPGGNAAVAQELSLRLRRAGARLETGALVVDVRETARGVQITFVDAADRLRAVLADRCVVALPKMVARIVVEGLSAEQSAAMHRIKYRAYLTANVLIRGRVPARGYDLYAEPTADLVTDPRHDADLPAFTDLIFGNWASGDAGENSVLTLYRPLPYDGAAQFLFSPDAFARHRRRIETALTPLLRGWGVDESRVHDIRQTRFGHSIPVAQTGLWSSGTLAQASAPVNGRIFFCGQDNYANPCFESAAKSAWAACEQLVHG